MSLAAFIRNLQNTPPVVRVSSFKPEVFEDVRVGELLDALSLPSERGDSWIPLSERLPQPEHGADYVPVLFNLRGAANSVCAGRFRVGNIKWRWRTLQGRECTDADVSHWQPLPGPPKTANPERRSSLELSEVKPDGNEGRSGEVDREGCRGIGTARSDAVGAGRAECGPCSPSRKADQEGLTPEGGDESFAPSATCEHRTIGYCEKCALRDPGELGEQKPQLISHDKTAENVTTEMVSRFLSWPLPDSVCSDGCVTQRDYGKAQGWPKRRGTNLLTSDEARQMLEHVLRAAGPMNSASQPMLAKVEPDGGTAMPTPDAAHHFPGDKQDLLGLVKKYGFFCHQHRNEEAVETFKKISLALSARGEALHASAPAGHKCSDCFMDKEPCPLCYATWWTRQHPNVTQT